MKQTRKFLLISVGGLVTLMLLGMVFAAFTATSSEEITSHNLIAEWKWYRMAFYAGLIASWPMISRYATRLGTNAAEAAEQDHSTWAAKREKDFLHLRSQWWKIALLLVFVEFVLIQQFGLGA